jgi:hypothetical protein
VAVWNTVNAVGWFGGAMLGSWLATVAPSEVRLFSWHLELASNLPVVFFISGMLRLIVSLSLLGTFQERRTVESASSRELFRELLPLKTWTGKN